MPLPALRERLAETLTLSAWSSLADPLVHEALLRSPFAAILLDMQHGLHDTASVAAGVAAAARLGKPAIVRVPIEDRAMAARALDLGASGVVMPMIETPAEAAAFVAAVKYSPEGLRSFGPSRAVDLHGYAGPDDYMAVANRETLAFAMIETRAALDDLGAILAVPGLDGVFVGPSDLSIALSPEGRRDVGGSATRAAIARILEAANAAGKLAGIYAASAEEARLYVEIGFRYVCVASDIALLRTGAAELVAAVTS
ncbi:2,4-dihydroxyhept-2-ene-1,7-dioic acid aldolase [Aureimonas endophytica]|uniref:2,4-dihydroxyhept-2-ene-1,7-dioic acid aldolase n=1 Tax=Aureimonas endophytica TaxID=2027858 RepID=A0A917E1Z4_9HYPH|nr:aldolase/citrate lyase family protein [Aureimonas endophytica]GGD91042.1 2,4-dihydroxyhept-2-ene-1,7-dioic acid aldolase [Aureimonas endophytica]